MTFSHDILFGLWPLALHFQWLCETKQWILGFGFKLRKENSIKSYWLDHISKALSAHCTVTLVMSNVCQKRGTFFSHWNIGVNVILWGQKWDQIAERKCVCVRVCVHIKRVGPWREKWFLFIFLMHVATHTGPNTLSQARGASLSLKEQDTPVSASSPPHTPEQRVYTMRHNVSHNQGVCLCVCVWV